jgi:hypothetical protein
MKALHLHSPFGWFAEHNSDLLFALARMESSFLKNDISQVSIDRPIYVTGLARSGTTVLLELLAQNEGVASYRYMDFPFIMLPYWWARLLDLRSGQNYRPVERSHADGLMVTPESPEAMEEILWHYFFPECHNPDKRNDLDIGQKNPEFDTFYNQTICKLLLARKADRYLAKNNYNITRLNYILSVFPDARFVIPVRDPVWHIASLIKQHRLLSENETRDKRILAYMRRSKHFEFGLDLRPLTLISKVRTNEILKLWNEGKNIEAWAKYWRDVHMYLANLLEGNEAVAESALVVSYEDLCRNPQLVLSHVYSHVGLKPDQPLFELQCGRLHLPSYYKPDFSENDIEIIQRETSDTHRRLLNLNK